MAEMSRVLRLCSTLLCLIVYLQFVQGAQVYTSDDTIGKDKVRLTDISTLTLNSGRYTTGRRSSPVPQLQCVGGTAGCTQYQPSVVQCYNKGYDGVDVQWECKADLDNRVKLGAIEVVCEGYDYPDDPYVLKGSCGLEYQLNLKSGTGGSSSENVWKPTKNRGFMFSDLLILAVAALIVYALYKTCLTTPQYSSTSSDYPDGRPGSFGGSYPSAPPPSYFGGGSSSNDYYGADCHGSSHRHGSGRGGGMGSGTFWTGAATGGILGYLFGQRNQGGFGGGQGYNGYRSERSSGWGWGGSSGGGGGGMSSGTSSSTSFGGTRRR